jgi:RNA polymerase sigma-70 factor (ECF subfamily)
MHSTDAFERLYRSHRSGLFTYALSLLGDETAAEDVVHDVFGSLCESPPRAHDLRAFVVRCVRNRALDLLRRRQRSKEHPAQQDSIYAVDDRTHWNGVLSKDQARRIDRAMQALRTEEREIIVLHVYNDMTFHQIARALDAPMGTVVSRYRRGLARLREKLEGEVSE